MTLDNSGAPLDTRSLSLSHVGDEDGLAIYRNSGPGTRQLVFVTNASVAGPHGTDLMAVRLVPGGTVRLNNRDAAAMSAHWSTIMKTCASIAGLCVLGIVMNCGNRGPTPRSLPIVVQTADDVWSGTPPQYAPTTIAPTGGLLIFENNDDSDSAGGPDDSDAIVNGPADMRQMTTLIVRKLSTTPSASDVLRVRKNGGMGNVNVFRKGATPAASGTASSRVPLVQPRETRTPRSSSTTPKTPTCCCWSRASIRVTSICAWTGPARRRA